MCVCVCGCDCVCMCDCVCHLYSLHQQDSLHVVLIRFQDEVSQLVDDDVQRALLLQGQAQVQLGAQGHRSEVAD